MKISFKILTLILLLMSIGAQGSFLNAFKDAILSSASILTGLLNQFDESVKNIGWLQDIISDAVEENCVFQCPNGERPYPRLGYIPTADGCGALGLKIDMRYLPQMRHCCDKHDICYDTCNSFKDQCDFEFKQCLYQKCKEITKLLARNGNTAIDKTCKTAAKMLHTGTLALGCKAYKDAQKNACECKPPPYGWKHQRNEL